MSRISALKNKISKLKEENNKLEKSFTLEYIRILKKEIVELKQEGQCKQVSIDSLQYKLDRANKTLKDASETFIKLDEYIQNIEDKKFKNRLKKLFVS